MKKILILMMVLFSTSSCNMSKWCAKRFPPSVTEIEKTEYKEIIKDTIIYLKGDSVKIIDSIPCPEKINKKIEKSKGNSTIKVDIKDNIITAEAICDSLEKVIQLKNIEISKLKEKNEKKLIKEKYIPNYFLYSGIILPIFILLLFFFKRSKILPF